MAQQLTTDILSAALEHLTAKRQQLDDQITEVKRLLSGSGNHTEVASDGKPAKRTMSAAGRRAIAEAQKRRWAAAKGAGSEAPTKSPKKTRKLSAAGRRAISAAAKKRWALKRAASGAGANAPAPKSPSKRASAKKTPTPPAAA
jgi:hypothetical protein